VVLRQIDSTNVTVEKVATAWQLVARSLIFLPIPDDESRKHTDDGQGGVTIRVAGRYGIRPIFYEPSTAADDGSA